MQVCCVFSMVMCMEIWILCLDVWRLYLHLIPSLLSIIQFLKHVQCGHELRDYSEKAKLKVSDPDSQLKQEHQGQFTFFRPLNDLSWPEAMLRIAAQSTQIHSNPI